MFSNAPLVTLPDPELFSLFRNASRSPNEVKYGTQAHSIYFLFLTIHTLYFDVG